MSKQQSVIQLANTTLAKIYPWNGVLYSGPQPSAAQHGTVPGKREGDRDKLGRIYSGCTRKRALFLIHRIEDPLDR